MSPFPDVHTAFNLIRQEEGKQQMHLTESTVETPLAMAFTKANNFPSKQPFKHNTGGPRRDSESTTKSSKEGMYCKHCRKDNHNTEKCFRLFGFPPRKKPNNNGRSYSANQVTSHSEESSNQQMDLTNNQCNQIIEFLKTKVNGDSSQHHAASVSAISGSSHLEENWHGQHD
ncbi:uncharacterized protein LOC119980850 [Tripterygium wilfordii]|uniref:uncharacterized protein LOC119980850 n=1 Tax=Tripterygium wilfordii TaxID=458696 RepID=UPI0018F80487|nr:uncharacterized protein LOC119980850 [Tripterygium wilfordii]